MCKESSSAFKEDDMIDWEELSVTSAVGMVTFRWSECQLVIRKINREQEIGAGIMKAIHLSEDFHDNSAF